MEQETLIAIGFALFMASFVVFPLARIEIVHQATMKAIGVAHERALASIEKGEEDWMRHYREIEGDNTWMLFDIRKWTFKQFYPYL